SELIRDRIVKPNRSITFNRQNRAAVVRRDKDVAAIDLAVGRVDTEIRPRKSGVSDSTQLPHDSVARSDARRRKRCSRKQDRIRRRGDRPRKLWIQLQRY